MNSRLVVLVKIPIDNQLLFHVSIAYHLQTRDALVKLARRVASDPFARVSGILDKVNNIEGTIKSGPSTETIGKVGTSLVGTSGPKLDNPVGTTGVAVVNAFSTKPGAITRDADPEARALVDTSLVTARGATLESTLDSGLSVVFNIADQLVARE